MDPLTVIGVLGSAASIASYLSSYRQRDGVQRIRKIEAQDVVETAGKVRRVVNQEYVEILASEDGLELINSLTIISPRVLLTLEEQLEGAEADYAKCLETATNESESHACDRKYEAKICDVLNRIRRRNGDKLPESEFMNNLWQSFRCSMY